MTPDVKRELMDRMDWILDRIFNPKGYYKDGVRLRTFKELQQRPRNR